MTSQEITRPRPSRAPAAAPALTAQRGASGKARIRYRPLIPKDRDQDDSNRLWRGASLALAPVVGSRLLFPTLFDRSLAALQKGPRFYAVNSAYASWYFGASLSITVDPARLRLRLSDYVLDGRGSRWIGKAFLDAADWSGALAPLAGSPVHREMVELAAFGPDYRSTRAYRAAASRIETGRLVRRSGILLDSMESVEAYFRYCSGLIESIRANGVVPRTGLRAVRAQQVGEGRPVRFDLAETDIGTAINADGSLIRHLGGKHRTAIAQALKLPGLPVRVAMVHAAWLAAEVERSGLPAHLALIDGVGRLQARGLDAKTD